MDVKLVVTTGKHAGQILPIDGPEFLIGRAKECNLRPRDERISRRHCMIVIEGHRALIREFGSGNGTFINGQRLQGEQELKGGDRLKVGDLEFEVQLGVGLGGRKKPKVKSVGEAAERLAQSSGQDDLDVVNWLSDDDEEAAEGGTSLHPVGGDKSMTSPNAISENQPGQPKPTEDDAKKAPAAPAKARDAAADILKNLFKNK